MGLRLFVVSLIVVGALAAPTKAALVSISSINAVDTSPYDLTNVYGLDDWAYWAQTASPVTQPVTPSNEKSGASLIGSISTVGGGNVRGTTNGVAAAYNLAFADGTAPLSGTASNLRGLFNSQLGPGGLGTGIQLNVTAPSADPFNIYVWGTAFQGTASLTADVGMGLATATDSTYIGLGGRSPGRFYTIQVTPDSAGQLVNIQMLMTAQTDANANVSLSAVAVTAIPEPGTMALLLGGGVLGLVTWQRRRTSNPR